MAYGRPQNGMKNGDRYMNGVLDNTVKNFHVIKGTYFMHNEIFFMCIYIHTRIYIYIYIYVHTHTHTQGTSQTRNFETEALLNNI
jgi:hypothetical protein